MSNKKEALQGLLNKKTTVNTKIQETVNTVIQKKGDSPKKKATFELDSDLHRDLKIFATKQNKKMVDVVEIALREHMSSKKS